MGNPKHPDAPSHGPSSHADSRPSHKKFDGGLSPMPMPARLGSMGGVKSTEADTAPEMHVPTGHLAHEVKKFKLSHLSSAGWNLKSRTSGVVAFGCITGAIAGLLAGVAYALVGLIGSIFVGGLVFTLSSWLFGRKQKTPAFPNPPVLAWTFLGLAIGGTMFFPEYHGHADCFIIRRIIDAIAIALMGSFILTAIFQRRRKPQP
ncbi:MAG: hypothetical protein WC712_08055 [Candidatus Brocadiia bacterium]